MRAVVADLSTSRYLWTMAAGRLRSDAGWGPLGLLSLREIAPPPLPSADGWLRVTPELAGICGSDLGLAHAKISFALSGFYTAERIVPGHEVVGVVTEGGPGVSRIDPGDRVVIDPILSCAPRGLEPSCGRCASGMPHVCERFDTPGSSGCTSPGQGFDIAVGGGWGESMVAHESQVIPVPADLPSRRGVLAEPASIGRHAALRWSRQGERAVVIGSGTIGLLVTAALRGLHPDLDIVVLSPGEFGAARARDVGASRTLPSGRAALEALAQQDGGGLVRPRMTNLPILRSGVDVVFDCVGTTETIDLGLHLLRSGGSLVLVGAAGRQSMDWSLVWNRELTVLGAINSGPEPGLGGRRTMAQVVDWLSDDSFPVDGLVTHVRDLDDWREALAIADAGPARHAVKVALRLDPGVALVGA